MAFKKHDWKNFSFGERNENVTGKLIIEENKREIDHFVFNDNEGWNQVIIRMKKYGFGKNVYVNTKKKSPDVLKENEAKEEEHKENGFDFLS